MIKTLVLLVTKLAVLAIALLLPAAIMAMPANPTGLAGTLEGNQVNLSWSAQSDVASFNVYQDDNYLTTTTDNQYSLTVDENSVHTYYVVAVSAAPVSFSGRSDQITIPESALPDDLTVPPSIPQGLTGNISGTTVTLNWEASTDDETVSGYNVYENNGYLTTVFSTSYEGTVVEGSTYVYAVVAFDIRQNFSATSSTLTLPLSTVPLDPTIPPSTPASLSGSIDGSSVSLSWEASTDDQLVLGYNIYENNSYLTTVFANQYTGNVNEGQVYSYYVVAFDNNTNFSTQSDRLTLPESSQPIDTTIPPTQVTGLSGDIVTSDNGSSVVLSWLESTDDQAVAGYNVYENNQYRTTVFDTNYQGSYIADSINSYYVVAFDFDSNFAPASNSLTLPDSPVTPDVVPPTAANMTGTLVDNGTTSSVTLSWSASNDDRAVNGYNVYENNQYITTVNTTNFETNVTSGATYSYYVVAFDGAGNYSQPSNRVTLPEGDNRPPEFDGFEDLTIFAGETLNLLVRPTDIDGDTPGLFTSGLPVGMESVDNLNGTRTLQWRPLQPQVGFYDLTATAIDSQDSTLQTTKTIRLTVELPEDQSNIPNLPPSIDLIEEHVVRIGDTVVMEVKGTDPNGTLPELTLLNPPEGSTFLPRPGEPLVKVLRWTTDDADFGLNELNFKVVDAVDSSLTFQTMIPLRVDDPANFVRPGSRLRELAEQRDFLIGYASILRYFSRPDTDLYQSVAREEFNLVTTENSMKWGYINPRPGEYRWDAADAEAQFAIDNNMLLHGHTLVWYASLPRWVQETPVAERENVMYDFIDTLTERYPTVAIWDVVNEAFEENGTYRNSVWFQAMGEEHISKAFLRAQTGAPNAQLIYNDYDIAFAGPKSDATYTMMQQLVADGIPVDGIGFQMHLDTSFDRFEEVAINFQRFADLGLDVYVTEFDVSMLDGATAEEQGTIVETITNLCLAQPACKALQMWGVTDRYSWRKEFTPLILDKNYQVKPAYLGLQNALMGN